MISVLIDGQVPPGGLDLKIVNFSVRSRPHVPLEVWKNGQRLNILTSVERMSIDVTVT